MIGWFLLATFAQSLDDTENATYHGSRSSGIVLLFRLTLRLSLGLGNNAAIPATFVDFYIDKPPAILSATLSPGLAGALLAGINATKGSVGSDPASDRSTPFIGPAPGVGA